MKELNANKICFITVVSNIDKYNESAKYLQRLKVPEGMTVESLVVQGGHSMTEAYQKGMEKSDAKYKVYIHQNAWITQDDFLEVMVAEFKAHPEYGIAGVIGSDALPESCVWWDGHPVGAIRDSHTGEMKDYLCERNAHSSKQAMLLDGRILMTQYDIPWRTDLFDKWIFYDASQCMEFRCKGYQVVVLPQMMPAVTHTGGISLDGYEAEKNKFIAEYVPKADVTLDGSIKVLVVIPTYNRTSYFKEALESVLRQTYTNLEIVISDDSTNDLTEELMQGYLSDERIKYYRHKGFTAQQNWAFLRKYVQDSECQYVNWLMDDDIFHEDKIARMLRCYLENDNVALVTSHRQIIDGEGRYMSDADATRRICQRTSRVPGDVAGSLMLRTHTNFIGEPTTVLFDKRHMKNGGDFGWTDLEGDYAAEDYSTFLHILEKGDMIYIADTLSYFRLHGENMQNNLGIWVRSTICWMIDIQYAYSRNVYLHSDDDYRQAAYIILKVAMDLLYRTGLSGIQNEDTRELWKHFVQISSQLGEIEQHSKIESHGAGKWERLR